MTSSTRPSNRRHFPYAADGAGFGAIFCLLALMMNMAAWPAWAQGVPATPLQAASAVKRPDPVAPVKSSSAQKMASPSAWQDLTPAQQLSLRPLAAHWGSLDQARKRKWIALAANYSALAPAEQAKLHSRMTEWVSLSQQQRAQARFNFSRSKQLSSAEKAATWQAYQALSPEEKQKLAISAPPKPAGAAAATKPVSPGKLTRVPVTKRIAKQLPEVPAVNQVMNRKTLLPHLKPLPEPKPAPTN